MVYSLDVLKNKIAPIATKYNLTAVYLFGSYARDEATEDSDVDILIDKTDSSVKGWIIGGLYNDLCDVIDKEVDMITTDTLEHESTKIRTPWFVDNIMMERVPLYER